MSLFSPINIIKGAGGLGRPTPPEDGVCGLVVQGASIGGSLGQYAPVQLKSVKDAEDLLLSTATDQAGKFLVYYHVTEFFRLNPEGELWLMLTAQSNTDWDLMADKDALNTGAKKLLNAAGGRIRLLGFAFNPVAAYTPVLSGGMDAQVLEVVGKAQELAEDEFSLHRPVQCIVEGRHFNGTTGSATNLRTLQSPNVSVVIGNDRSPDWNDSLANDYGGNPHVLRHAGVGAFLGALSRFQVNWNVGWVQNGDIQNTTSKKWLVPGISSDVAVSSLADSERKALSDKGYVFAYKDHHAPGTYWNDSHTCTGQESDYFCIENNRVMDKAVIGVRRDLFPFVNAPVRVNQDGTVDKLVLQDLQNKGSRNLRAMELAGEISGYDIRIDPAQNILANSELKVEFAITPTGTARKITAYVNFSNPFQQ